MEVGQSVKLSLRPAWIVTKTLHNENLNGGHQLVLKGVCKILVLIDMLCSIHRAITRNSSIQCQGVMSAVDGRLWSAEAPGSNPGSLTLNIAA